MPCHQGLSALFPNLRHGFCHVGCALLYAMRGIPVMGRPSCSVTAAAGHPLTAGNSGWSYCPEKDAVALQPCLGQTIVRNALATS